jgi:DOMON domain/Eukaryotic cytochrome b561
MAYEILWRVHAILMSSSFLSMCSAVLISLIWKQKKWRYKAHRALGIYAGVAGVVALITAVTMVQINSGYHLSSRHAIGGSVTALLLISTPLVALRIRKSKKKKMLKRIHKILGYMTLVFMAAAIFFGLLFVGLISLSEKPSQAVIKQEAKPLDSDSSMNQVSVSGITFSWELTEDFLDGTLEAETEGWIAIGLNPEQMMQGADFIIGYVKDDEVFIQDDYGSWLTSHVSDLSMGGQDDIQIIGGEESGGRTVIRFRKPLTSADEFDHNIIRGETISVLFALGTKDDFTSMHRGRGKADITF